MEEINVMEILAYLKSKLIYIILIIAVAITCGIIYSNFYKVPLYQSTSTIVLASPEASTDTLQSDISLNQKLVETYKVIVKSKAVLEEVIEMLDLDVSYESLNNKVSVDSVSNTEVIMITVTDEEAKEATEIVTTITDVFAKEVTALYDLQNIRILDQASTPNGAYNINLTKDIMIYFLVGTVVSFAVFMIGYLFDKTLKSVEQVESIGDLPVIGTVPIAKKKRGNIYE